MSLVPSAPPGAGRSAAPFVAVVVGQLSVQIGAAFAKGIFGLVPATAMTWVRVAWATAFLALFQVVVSRRPGHVRGSHRPLGPALGYVVCILAMNWSIYQAFQYIPLGVAVTIEFLGPLVVSVAHSRRLVHLLWTALALAGVVVLEWSPTAPDGRGIAYALVAAIAWGGYIVCGSRLGSGWPGTDALLLACAMGTVVLAAPAVGLAGHVLWTPHVLVTGAAIGLLSSVVPYALELFAIREIPPRVFGILMALEPVIAALAALVVLGERLGWMEIVAMVCIVAASIGATRSA